MQIPGEKSHVGAGWHKILDDLHAEIVQFIPNYSVHQVKEKFGGLRVYMNYSPSPGKPNMDRAETLIREAEKKCLVTCEVCGKPGKNQAVGTWWQTVCDSDAVKTAAQHRADMLEMGELEEDNDDPQEGGEE